MILGLRNDDSSKTPLFFVIDMHEVRAKYLRIRIINLQPPNDIYIYISYRTANLQTLHFIY
jgi:hypothetical protein